MHTRSYFPPRVLVSSMLFVVSAVLLVSMGCRSAAAQNAAIPLESGTPIKLTL